MDAERRARDGANRERDRSHRKSMPVGNSRRMNPTRRRAAPPLDLLARALAAGVSIRQSAHDLDIPRFKLDHALQQQTVRLAHDESTKNRGRLRALLRQTAAARAPSHQRLVVAAEPLAAASAAGVPLRQAAADLGVAPSTLTRVLQRARSPGAAEHLKTIRSGYDAGQERQRECRSLLQQARARPEP